MAALCVGPLRPALVIRHARLVLGLLFVISAAALLVLVRFEPLRLSIGVDPATEPLISRDEPGVPIYQQATRDFGNDDLYVIAMEVIGEGDVFAREHLETLRTLTHQLRGLPGIASVESLARVSHMHYDAEADLVGVDQFMRQVPKEEEARLRLREQALADPFYRKTLLSEDARTTGINIAFQPMTDTTRAIPMPMAYLP